MSDAITVRRTLGLDVEVLQGFAFNSGGFSQEKGLPLIRIRDLMNSTTETNYYGPFSEAYVVDRGDVLIGMDGDFRVVRWSGERALLNQRVCRIRPSYPFLDEGFLFHAIKPEVERVHRRTPQTTVRHLNTEGIRACMVLDVPLEEQRRIADILDTMDEAIQSTERVIVKRKSLCSGLLSDLVYSPGRGEPTRRSSQDGKNYVPAKLRTSGRKNRNSWRFATLKDLADILDNRRVPVREEDRPPGLVPYYGANGQQGWIDRPLFEEPLILLAEDGGHFDEFQNRPIAYRIDGPSWVNNHAHVLRARDGINQSFLYWSLRNKDIRRWISGGTRSKLTRGEMEQVVVPVPPLREQRRIAEILDTIDDSIRANEQQREKLCQLRSGLATDVLSGRVRTVAA